MLCDANGDAPEVKGGQRVQSTPVPGKPDVWNPHQNRGVLELEEGQGPLVTCSVKAAALLLTGQSSLGICILTSARCFPCSSRATFFLNLGAYLRLLTVEILESTYKSRIKNPICVHSAPIISNTFS